MLLYSCGSHFRFNRCILGYDWEDVEGTGMEFQKFHSLHAEGEYYVQDDLVSTPWNVSSVSSACGGASLYELVERRSTVQSQELVFVRVAWVSCAKNK